VAAAAGAFAAPVVLAAPVVVLEVPVVVDALPDAPGLLIIAFVSVNSVRAAPAVAPVVPVAPSARWTQPVTIVMAFGAAVVVAGGGCWGRASCAAMSVPQPITIVSATFQALRIVFPPVVFDPEAGCNVDANGTRNEYGRADRRAAVELS